MHRQVLVLIDLTAYGSGVVRGIQEYTHWSGPCMFSLDARGVLPPPGRMGQLQEWKGHGIITQARDDTFVKALRALKIPVVNVAGGMPIERSLPSVITDHPRVGRLAAADLLQRDLRHFAVYGQAGLHRSDQRAMGFNHAVQQAGYTCQTYMPKRMPASERGWERRRTALGRWLQQLPKPVGVLACGDVFGWQLLEAAQASAVAVPDEVAVIGVGDNEVICRMTRPPLSSVALMPERVGHEAAALLDRLMAGEAPPTEPITIAPKGVTCRQSSDILAVDDANVLKAAKFIRQHAHEPIQVNDVVEQVAISRRSLERRFMGVLGRSLHTEIRRAHIERAKRLLIETRLSINEVAAASGFTNATHLGVAFREQTDMTPGEYRRNGGA